MYHLEEGGKNGSEFKSIPCGIYWAVQTIFTVGYGDIYPHSYIGMLFGAVFMLTGPGIMCVPLLSIITKFADEYEGRTK